MTDEQAYEIIEKVFKAHWPNWRFEEEETLVWIKTLRRFDFNKAKAAINNLYMSWEKQGKPPAAKIKNALRSTVESKQSNGPIILYEIIRKGKKHGMRFCANSIPPIDELEREAGEKLERCNQLYNREHILIRHWENEVVPF